MGGHTRRRGEDPLPAGEKAYIVPQVLESLQRGEFNGRASAPIATRGDIMQTEKRPKYFVNRRESVTIRCQACGRVATFSVASFRGRKHSLKVHCPCTAIFAVDLEFRQDYRTPAHIPATYRALSTPKARARNCVVANQSTGGLLLAIDEEVPVKANDRLIVCYRPQTDISQEIERIITVRHHLRGNSIGGAFIDAPVQPPLMTQPIRIH